MLALYKNIHAYLLEYTSNSIWTQFLGFILLYFQNFILWTLREPPLSIVFNMCLVVQSTYYPNELKVRVNEFKSVIWQTMFHEKKVILFPSLQRYHKWVSFWKRILKLVMCVLPIPFELQKKIKVKKPPLWGHIRTVARHFWQSSIHKVHESAKESLFKRLF